MRRRQPSLYLVPALLLALIFVITPGLPLDLLPAAVQEGWDGLVQPIRSPVTQFWWQFIRGGDQQRLFNLLTYASMVAILVLPWIALRWLWIRRRRAAARFR